LFLKSIVFDANVNLQSQGQEHSKNDESFKIDKALSNTHHVVETINETQKTLLNLSKFLYDEVVGLKDNQDKIHLYKDESIILKQKIKNLSKSEQYLKKSLEHGLGEATVELGSAEQMTEVYEGCITRRQELIKLHCSTISAARESGSNIFDDLQNRGIDISDNKDSRLLKNISSLLSSETLKLCGIKLDHSLSDEAI